MLDANTVEVVSDVDKIPRGIGIVVVLLLICAAILGFFSLFDFENDADDVRKK